MRTIHVEYGAVPGINDPEHYLIAVSTLQLILEDSAEYKDRTEYGDTLYGCRKDVFSYVAGKRPKTG